MGTRMTETLYRCAQHEGEHVRLDWDAAEEDFTPSRMSRSERTDALVRSMQWKHPRSWQHTLLSHINLQEYRAYSRELWDLGKSGIRDKRVIFANDSRVCVGCVAKGRSSSRVLNGVLRRCLPWSLLGRQIICNIHVGTHCGILHMTHRGRYPYVL